jgi:hypothetical protein
MKEYTKKRVDEMREMLANSEWEGLRDRDLREVLWDGCVGWKNMPDKDVAENWENVYGEWKD